MGLCDDVRAACAAIAAGARAVRIDREALTAYPAPPAPPPAWLELPGLAPPDAAAHVLIAGTVNFGSGWWPTVRKRPGMSGARTMAAGLAERSASAGPWTPEELRGLTAAEVAAALGQDPAHELMGLYAQALRDLGGFLGGRTAAEAVAEAGGSAERLATALAAMPFYQDRGFFKRAQIVPRDLALAGAATFGDLGRLTIFADNLVPHVLRVDGVLRYAPDLAAAIDRGGLLPPGGAEREIRACAVHACAQLARRTGIAEHELDGRLWARGQAPAYKALPRHRTRTVFY
jgi:Potential Queuosine, Q, salvage protein family